MAHPGDSDYVRPSYPSPPKGTPLCQYGERCYRRNPMHFIEYSHNFQANNQNDSTQNVSSTVQAPQGTNQQNVIYLSRNLPYGGCKCY